MDSYGHIGFLAIMLFQLSRYFAEIGLMRSHSILGKGPHQSGRHLVEMEKKTFTQLYLMKEGDQKLSYGVG